MGGQNHQPCNKKGTHYLEFSTKMSRDLSKGRIHLEQANVLLEDILLAELARRPQDVSVYVISDYLDDSRNRLEEMETHIRALFADMEKNDYEELPTLFKLDLKLLGEAFVERGMVEQSAWDTVVAKMISADTDFGFSAVLELFLKQIDELKGLTVTLATKIEKNDTPAQNRQLNEVLEQNLPGNFKVEFAQLYSKWHAFQQLFLASSMLSTELWYRHQRVGSLTDDLSQGIKATG